MTDAAVARLRPRGMFLAILAADDPGLTMARKARRLLRERPHATAAVLTAEAAVRRGIHGSRQIVSVTETGTSIYFALYNSASDPVHVAIHEIAHVGHDEEFVAA